MSSLRTGAVTLIPESQNLILSAQKPLLDEWVNGLPTHILLSIFFFTPQKDFFHHWSFQSSLGANHHQCFPNRVLLSFLGFLETVCLSCLRPPAGGSCGCLPNGMREEVMQPLWAEVVKSPAGRPAVFFLNSGVLGRKPTSFPWLSVREK